MKLDLRTSPQGEAWLVSLRVRLDRQETNELFLAGDKLLSWPTDGMLSADGPMDRSSMFLSEIASRETGLQLRFAAEESAERVAKILAYQVRAAFPEG